MELCEAELYNLISKTAGSMRKSLQALSVSLDLLSDKLDLADETVSRQAAAAMQSIYQLQRTAAYMDLFRQFNSGDYRLDLQKADLSAFLQQFAEMAKDMLACSGIRLLTELPKTPVIGYVDRRLIELLAWELLGNAAAHASDSQVRLTLRRPQPRLLVLTVQNRSDQDLPEQLFSRFSEQPTESTDTVGLGLQVVSLGAQRHGGSLVLSRGPDQTV